MPRRIPKFLYQRSKFRLTFRFSITKSTNFRAIRGRFCHRLDAPAALLKESGESTVTYLNKGAHYSLLVEDQSSSALSPGRKTYRTSVQVTFDTEYQRHDPAPHWQLWSESRGTSENHSFGGIFRAIEPVTSRKPYSEVGVANLEAVHSDGFSMVWNAEAGEPRQYAMNFQLNFLSTDFSHSKGVNGVAMRLSGKTEEVLQGSLPCSSQGQETKFCRIKLFRSHGAERKMTNDIAVTDRRIKRLRQHLIQPRLAKVTRHPQDKSSRPKRSKVDDEGLRKKILKLQKTLNSARSHSFLDQEGHEQESCDWYTMNGEQGSSPRPQYGAMQSSSDQWSTSIPTDMDPTDSILSPQPTEFARPPWNLGSSRRVSVSTHPTHSENEPPVPREISPVARFYIRAINPNALQQNDPYTAIYLLSLTAAELKRRIAVAVFIDPDKVARIIWRSAKGINVLVDDDVVGNIPEDQDMEICIASKAGESRDEGHGGTDELIEIKLVF